MNFIKRIINMANMANTRLNRARAKYPASEYVNEMQSRMIAMTRLYPDLLTTGIHGIQLTRSKSKWMAVPPGMAEAILLEVNGVGQMWQMEDRARDILNRLGKDASDANMRAIIEGKFNFDMKENNIWDLAYEMRTTNQTLYDIFGELHGNGKESWKYSDAELEEIFRRELLFGEGEIKTGQQLPSSYGLNQRKEEKNKAARAIGKEASRSNPDPEFLANQLYNYAAAQFGTTTNGKFTPADPTELTSEQMRSIIETFFK